MKNNIILSVYLPEVPDINSPNILFSTRIFRWLESQSTSWIKLENSSNLFGSFRRTVFVLSNDAQSRIEKVKTNLQNPFVYFLGLSRYKLAFDPHPSVELEFTSNCKFLFILEFQKIAIATAIGFAIMGFIGFFVKLIHIPINNIIVGS